MNPLTHNKEWTMDEMSSGAVYGIFDTKAKAYVGNVLMIHKTDNVAIRSFTDIAKMHQSAIGNHIEDYNLIRVGYLTLDNDFILEEETILTGTQWKNSQPEDDNA